MNANIKDVVNEQHIGDPYVENKGDAYENMNVEPELTSENEGDNDYEFDSDE